MNKINWIPSHSEPEERFEFGRTFGVGETGVGLVCFVCFGRRPVEIVEGGKYAVYCFLLLLDPFIDRLLQSLVLLYHALLKNSDG